MAALEKKWKLELRTCAKNGDLSSVWTDILDKLCLIVSAPRRHALAVEILKEVSSLLRDAKIQLNQAVHDTSCLIVAQCCKAVETFDDETQMFNFLCSLYHSLNAFLEQDMIKEVLNMKQNIVLIKGKDLQCSEKISGIFKNIWALYFKKIVTPLRDKYDRDSTDESYFPLIAVLDDCVELLMCGGIHNLLFAVSNSHVISKLNSAHLTGRDRLVTHLAKVVRMGGICRKSSCELIQNNSEFCRQYLYIVNLVVNHNIKMDDTKRANEALLEIDHVMSFFKSNCKLHNFVKFYKHFTKAIIGLVDDDTSEIEKNFERSFDALSSVTQETDIDEVTFQVICRICEFASNLLIHTFSKISQKSCKEWNQGINIGLLSSMHKVALEMDNVIDGNGHSDCRSSDGTVCPVKSSAKYNVSLMMLVSKSVQISMKHKLKDIHLLLPQAVIVQKTCLKHLESLKALGCIQWKSQWIYAASVSHNLGYYCNKSDLKYHQNSFFADLCEAFLKLEDLENPVLTSFSLWQSLSHLFDSYKLLRKYHSALVTLVIALAAVPDKKADIFQLWLTIKKGKLTTKLSTEDISLWKIYNKEKSVLKSKYRLDFEKNIVKNEIMVLELEVLRTTTAEDNLFNMENSLKVVEHLGHNLALNSRAILALLKTTWTNDDTPSKTVMSLGEAVLEKLPENFERDEVDVRFILAELAFWMFLCQLKTDRNRQKVEMDRGKENRIPMSLADLRRDETDVVPAYVNLDVRNETRMLSTLATAVDICRSILNAVQPEPYAKWCGGGWDKVRDFVEVAARIYEAYGYDQRALDCWGLLSELAAFMADRQTTLLALGHLLAELDHDDSVRALIETGDSLAETLLADAATSETQEIVISYHLNKSAGCLNGRRFAEGKAALKAALDLLARLPDGGGQTLMHVKAKLVTSKFQLLPPGVLDVSDLGDDTPHLTALTALVAIKKMAKIGLANHETRITRARHLRSIGHNSHTMKLLFAVAHWYAQLCVRQGFAREFGFSVPNLLISFQRQAFALRSAQILSVLAAMDLLCETPNCQVKIDGMVNITLLRKTGGCSRVQRKAHKEIISTPTFSRLQPTRNVTFGPRNLPESPFFEPTPFTTPEFISHDGDCQCLYCKNPEIQTVAFDITCLQARFYSLHGNSTQALEFFKGAMRIHYHLLAKQTASFNCLAERLPSYLKLSLRMKIDKGTWKCSLFSVKLHTDLSYIDFHARHNLIEKSLEMNLSLAASLKKFPLVDGFLYPEVLHQEFHYTLLLANKLQVPDGDPPSLSERNVERESIDQAVAETPLGSTKIAFTKAALRPFRIFSDRSTAIRPQIPLLNLKTPLPSLLANGNKKSPNISNMIQNKCLTGTKPVKSSDEILQDLLKECDENNTSFDFVELSPKVIATSQRKPRLGTGLTAKSKPRTYTRKLESTTIMKTENRSNEATVSNHVVPAVSIESSPIMPEAKKKLQFQSGEESVRSPRLKEKDVKKTQATEKGAVENPQKTVRTTASRSKSRLVPVDDVNVGTKSKKVNLLPDHRPKGLRQKKTEESHSTENLQCNGAKTKSIKAAKTNVPIRTTKLGISNDSSEAGSVSGSSKTADAVSQIDNLFQKIKVEDEENELQKLTKLRLTVGKNVTITPVKSKNVYQLIGKQVKAPMEKDLDLIATNLKCNGGAKAKGVKPIKTHAPIRPNKLIDSCDSSKTGTKVASKSSTGVPQITGMLQNVKLEEEDEENQEVSGRRLNKAKVPLIKSKIKTSGRSTSSSDSSTVNRLEGNGNLNNVLRSPLKAFLENVADVNSPVKTRRGRKVK